MCLNLKHYSNTWAPSSEFVSSSIPSWQILTAHAQPFRGARDLAFCLKVPLDSMLVWASSGGSGETARMRGLAWTFAARIGDKYRIRLARPTLWPCWFVSLQKRLTTVKTKEFTSRNDYFEYSSHYRWWLRFASCFLFISCFFKLKIEPAHDKTLHPGKIQISLGHLPSLHCLHEDALGPWLSTECTAKTLIRLGGCPGWSVFAGCTGDSVGFVMLWLKFLFQVNLTALIL